ncbi:N-acetylmuramoyl-L-alanine amidase [Mycolicibacillus trivialis]
MPIWSKDDIARIIINEGRKLGITDRGIIIGIAVGLVESNLTVYANASVPGSLDLPHDAVGSDGKSVGVQQQQVVWGNGAWWWGDVKTCQDPTTSSALFFRRLATLDYNGPNSPGGYAQAVQQSAYPLRYDQRMAEAQAYFDRLNGGTTVDEPRPDFNEFPIWSPSNQSRNGQKPVRFLLHTQEGGGGDAAAENLANYCANPVNAVSYHYYISQASDGGVTVVDGVDTDLASWSVGNANNTSINLCFAGSRAAWTRDQWMAQRNAIDVAAYLAVQDCKKYGMPTLVVPPPYSNGTPGISDHYWVTKIYGWGTHTDVGNGFPWDYFADRVAFWDNDGKQPEQPTPIEPPTHANFPDGWTDRDLMVEILRQLRGPQLKGWPQLGANDQGHSLTLVDAIAAIKNNRLVQP